MCMWILKCLIRFIYLGQIHVIAIENSETLEKTFKISQENNKKCSPPNIIFKPLPPSSAEFYDLFTRYNKAMRVVEELFHKNCLTEMHVLLNTSKLMQSCIYVNGIVNEMRKDFARTKIVESELIIAGVEKEIRCLFNVNQKVIQLLELFVPLTKIQKTKLEFRNYHRCSISFLSYSATECNILNRDIDRLYELDRLFCLCNLLVLNFSTLVFIESAIYDFGETADINMHEQTLVIKKIIFLLNKIDYICLKTNDSFLRLVYTRVDKLHDSFLFERVCLMKKT